jgi:hypothetical protein
MVSVVTNLTVTVQKVNLIRKGFGNLVLEKGGGSKIRGLGTWLKGI